MKRKFPKMTLILLIVICLALPVGALVSSAQTAVGIPNTSTMSDGGGGQTAVDKGSALPDDVRPEEVPGREVGQVAGVSDEAPDGMSIFWGIVISLLVAGAVVVGIVMLVPKEEEGN